MRVELIPGLETLRELYSMPRTMDRFQLYIDRMVATSDTGRPDVGLAITLVNPVAHSSPYTSEQAISLNEAVTQ